MLNLKYFLKAASLLGVVFSESCVLCVELLVGWGIDDLRVDLLLVVVLGESAPVYNFSTAVGQTDRVDIKSVEDGCLFWGIAAERYFSYLELWFWVN